MAFGLCSGAWAQATSVTLEKTPAGKWQLLRGGKPYIVKGVGGSDHLAELKAAGGNTIRTWGIDDNTGKLLDEAQKNGLGVVVGIWLGHERHGFDYKDGAKLAEQLAAVKTAVEKYKNHPAVLAWGLGNEMEAGGKNAAIWSHIECVAAMVKQLDKNHPTMTVTAELGEASVGNLHKLCPSIDIFGINSYGGAPSLLERYQKAGGTKPVLVTEFGPLGPWEVGKTAWGAPKEPTSTEKADWYEKAAKAIAADPLTLGSFAFLWGHKMEQTPTWFGMFLPTGGKVTTVDAMTKLWSGKDPADRCPAIEPLKLSAEEGDPGAALTASVGATDPEGKALTYAWELRHEQDRPGQGGDAEAETKILKDAVVASGKSAKITLPKAAGPYRLFVYVRDPAGNAATANIPLLVKGEPAAPPDPVSKLPLSIYSDKGAPTLYAPAGWMGNTAAITMDEAWNKAPHSGTTCVKFTFGPSESWGGVVWQSPAEDWGDKPGGANATGAKKLTFWAKGDFGGETVSFKYGILGKDKKFSDSSTGELPDVALTSTWKKYEIPVEGKDLSRVKTGFVWTVANARKKMTFYIDDIQFE